MSSDKAFLYVSNHLLLAGRWEMAAIIQSLANSCIIMLPAKVWLEVEALEIMSTVYSSLPGTSLISHVAETVKMYAVEPEDTWGVD